MGWLRIDWRTALTRTWPFDLEEEAFALLLRERQALPGWAPVTIVRENGNVVTVPGYREPRSR